MRRLSPRRLLVAIAALSLGLAACGNDDDGALNIDVPDGPTITVGSFDFPESTILAEVYAQTLEAAGYPVDRQLNIGSRELLLPELESGGIDLLPEYLGSALVVGFEAEAPTDVEAGVAALRTAFAELGVSVLAATPAENANVFVVLTDLAQREGLQAVGDLADLDGPTLAGPPECENRDTCYAGLRETYGLDGLGFSSIGEASARLVALTAGDVDVVLLFSTDAVLADDALTVLDEPAGIVPPENVVPVVRTAVLDAYGDDLTGLLERVGEELTTDVLIGMNDRANEGTAPAQIARDFLDDIGIVD